MKMVHLMPLVLSSIAMLLVIKISLLSLKVTRCCQCSYCCWCCVAAIEYLHTQRILFTKILAPPHGFTNFFVCFGHSSCISYKWKLFYKSVRSIVFLQEKRENINQFFVSKFVNMQVNSFDFSSSIGASGGLITVWNGNHLTFLCFRLNLTPSMSSWHVIW